MRLWNTVSSSTVLYIDLQAIMSLDAASDKHLNFWEALETLVASHNIVIERPRGSAHPRYPERIYTLDYGYLDGTTASNGGCIDVWVGSMKERHIGAAMVTVDLDKGDSEIKILLGCTSDENQTIFSFHNKGKQSAILIPREVEQNHNRTT